ncbi:MAG: NAD-dependent epimerase/dehydratase family protein [Clostridia bacterium]|nr:NAD-dependent epimerase/dehydratase family protein [Clostridia bacterium]
MRILITGEHGYIATALAAYLGRFPERYDARLISVRDFQPDAIDFHGVDAIVHTAAIVHQKETKGTQQLYDAVNCDLTVALAKKANREGVGQFVFFSTMSVYGMDTGTIRKDTVPVPNTQYGRSKLMAERRIAKLSDDSFTVTILRPPVVFGPGAKGNPARLERLAKKLPFCPDFENRRSMVSIETLCEAVKALLDAPRAGVFFPQEPAPIATCDLIERAMREQGRTPRRSKLLNPAIRLLRAYTRVGRKAFGDLVYEDLTAFPLPDGEEGSE